MGASRKKLVENHGSAKPAVAAREKRTRAEGKAAATVCPNGGEAGGCLSCWTGANLCRH